MSKQDRQACRTPAQLEQKYALGKLGKSFAEALDIASDAREVAEETSKEIEDMFTKNIVMTGTFTNTFDAFLYPGEEEVERIRQHLLKTILIPDDIQWQFDFNEDGVVDSIDHLIAKKASIDDEEALEILDKWTKATKTEVTLKIDLAKPDKAICISGFNMWGREVATYFGADYTSAKNPATEQKLNDLSTDYIVEESGRDGWEYRKWNSGIAECWGILTETIETKATGSVYCGAGFDNYYPFFFIEKPVVNVNTYGPSYCTPTLHEVTNDYFSLYYTTFSGAYLGDIRIFVHVIGKWK